MLHPWHGFCDLTLGEGKAMDEKQHFIDVGLNSMFKLWLRRTAAFGSFLFLLISILDYIVARDLFPAFLVYRLGIAAFLLAIAALAGKISNPRLLRLVGYAAILSSAVVIEVMILQFGGHASMYYTGMILLGVAVFGFFPASVYFHLAAAGLIYLTYLLPILLLDTVTDLNLFITSNFFMVTIFLTAVFYRHLTQRALFQELSMQYDLKSQQQCLEEVIKERTGELSSTVDELEAEVGERRRVEGVLSKALSEWMTTFDSAMDMIMTVDRNLRIVKANKAVADYLGRPVTSIAGEVFFDLFSDFSLPREEYPLEKMQISGSHEEMEFFSDQSKRWMTWIFPELI